MLAQTRRDEQAQIKAKAHVLDIIRSRYLKCRRFPTVYQSSEKNFFYVNAIKEAYKAVKESNDTPLNVLDGLLEKYDSWAHAGCSNDYVFSVSTSAVDDIIDLIISS